MKLKELAESLKNTLEEAKKDKFWIKKAIKHPGLLHKKLHVPPDEKIPASKINAASKKKGKLGKEARLAKVLSKLRKR